MTATNSHRPKFHIWFGPCLPSASTCLCYLSYQMWRDEWMFSHRWRQTFSHTYEISHRIDIATAFMRLPSTVTHYFPVACHLLFFVIACEGLQSGEQAKLKWRYLEETLTAKPKLGATRWVVTLCIQPCCGCWYLLSLAVAPLLSWFIRPFITATDLADRPLVTLGARTTEDHMICKLIHKSRRHLKHIVLTNWSDSFALR